MLFTIFLPVSTKEIFQLIEENAFTTCEYITIKNVLQHCQAQGASPIIMYLMSSF